MEVWKDINGLYRISSCGKIWSNYLDDYMVLIKGNNGYYYVSLNIDGSFKRYTVHRLVWKYFNGNIPEGMEVGHKDCHTSNNSLDNLYLCTHKENMNNPITKCNLSYAKKGRVVSEKTKKKLSAFQKGRPNLKLSKTVYQYTLDGELVDTYPSASEAARKNPGFSRGNITQCCLGKRNNHKGYIWSYKREGLAE